MSWRSGTGGGWYSGGQSQNYNHATYSQGSGSRSQNVAAKDQAPGQGSSQAAQGWSSHSSWNDTNEGRQWDDKTENQTVHGQAGQGQSKSNSSHQRGGSNAYVAAHARPSGTNVPHLSSNYASSGSTAGNPEVYRVYSKSPQNEEIVVTTLLGDYSETSSNHDRKVYKKVIQTGSADQTVDVYMYYWDARDGPNFQGWWFGNKLGGTQVWSHCASDSMTPPPSGWKVPWDGPVKDSMVVEAKPNSTKSSWGSSDALPVNQIGSSFTSLMQIGAAAKKALEGAKAIHGGTYDNPENVERAERLLQGHPEALCEAMKKLEDLQRNAPTGSDTVRQFAQLGSVIRAAQGAVATETTRLKQAKNKHELVHQAHTLKLEEKDKSSLQDLMPEAEKKTNYAEDAVEKAVIAFQMIEVGTDDFDGAREAVQQTEQVAQEAQKAISEARIFLNAKLATSRRFESEALRQHAAVEIGKLQKQLTDAQGKLNPLKNVRQDFVQRKAAQKLVQDILDRLSPAEVEVDRAEEATMMISQVGIGEELISEASKAAAKASTALKTVLQYIMQKKSTVTGIIRDEIVKLEDRTKSSQGRLLELRNQHKEFSEKALCENILNEAKEKLVIVNEALDKAREAEGPFLTGATELPLEETIAAVKACETAATSANTACSVAKMFLATKLVEAKRFVRAVSEECQSRLKSCQADLEKYVEKLQEIKKTTAIRKKAATVKEAEHDVVEAEKCVDQVAELASVFSDDSKLLEMSVAEIRQACRQTLQAEKIASDAVIEARKLITAKQIESKGKDVASEVSTELIKLQARLSAAQTAIAKFKQKCGSVEKRLAAKRIVEEVGQKVKIFEEKVEKLANIIEQLGSASTKAVDCPTEDKLTIKVAEIAAAEAQVTCKSCSRYLEQQQASASVRGCPIAKEELGAISPKVSAAQKRMESSIKAMKEIAEQIAVDGILNESEGRIKDAENECAKVTLAEELVNMTDGNSPVEDVNNLINALEVACQSAHQSVNGAKTMLAMKRLAANRLSGSALVCKEALASFQSRLDMVNKTVVAAKKGVSEKKLAIVKREGEAKVSNCAEQVQDAANVTDILAKATGKDTQEMKGLCEKAGAAQGEASGLIAKTKTFLQERQRDSKLAAMDVSMPLQLAKLLERLSQVQSDLDKQKSVLRDQEHKFVADRLSKDATDMVEGLEVMYKKSLDSAQPLTSDADGHAAGFFLGNIVKALRCHMSATSKTAADVYRDVRAGNDFDCQSFCSYMEKLDGLNESTNDFVFAEEHLKAGFSRMTAQGTAEVNSNDFEELFKMKFLVSHAVAMTENLEVKGSKTVRKLEVNEVLYQLSDPETDEQSGLQRVKARAEKDGKEGYITIQAKSGNQFLVPHDAIVAVEKVVEKSLKELQEAADKTQNWLENKRDELRSVQEGPLVKTKTFFTELEPRVRKVQQEGKQLTTRIVETKKKHQHALDSERKRRQEAAEKVEADRLTDAATEAITAVERAVDDAVDQTQVLANSGGMNVENPLQAMDDAELAVKNACLLAESTSTKMRQLVDGAKCATKGPLGEARAFVLKSKAKASGFETKCKKAAQALVSARRQVTTRAVESLKAALRSYAAKNTRSIDQLYADISGQSKEVTTSSLRHFLESIPDSDMKTCQLDLGCERLASTLTRLSLIDFMQEFLCVTKEVAITTAYEVANSKSLRKLTVGEIVEMLEFKLDDGTGLSRVRCRTLSDGKEGWATMRGNQGTSFMEKTSKRYRLFQESCKLHSSYTNESDHCADAMPGDVFEVLEGPRQEAPRETVRLKCRMEGLSGWVTIKDVEGNNFMEPVKQLEIKRGIAFTSTFNIAEGKALRKLDIGEVLEVVEGPRTDDIRHLTRAKARSKIDGKEGWVTLKGNQGTAYAEESVKRFACVKNVSFEKRSSTNSEELRKLCVGDSVEAIEKPSKEVVQGARWIRGRHVKTGVEGWFAVTQLCKEWTPRLKCLQATALHESLDVKEAKVVRKLEVGEFSVAVDMPSFDATTQLLRVKICAEKDGAKGFATLRGNMGTEMLKPVIEVSLVP